jgi:hypothetical protein
MYRLQAPSVYGGGQEAREWVTTKYPRQMAQRKKKKNSGGGSYSKMLKTPGRAGLGGERQSGQVPTNNSIKNIPLNLLRTTLRMARNYIGASDGPGLSRG